MGDLSKEYDRSKSTIQGIIEHREDTGTCKPTRRPGNSPILDADAEGRLVRHVRRDSKQKSSQIGDSAGVSASTAERIMKKHSHKFVPAAGESHSVR
jgi:transposase